MATWALLAVIGAVFLALGVGLAWMPGGLLVAGLEALAGAYAGAYLSARRGVRR